MKRVYLARDQVDAEMTLHALAAERIEAVIRSDSFPTGAIPFPSVWVEEVDENRAREILASRHRAG
jgi:hypothetical protein